MGLNAGLSMCFQIGHVTSGSQQPSIQNNELVSGCMRHITAFFTTTLPHRFAKP